MKIVHDDARYTPGLHRRLTGAMIPSILLFALACGGPAPVEVVAKSDLCTLTRAELEAFTLRQPEERQRPAEGQSLQDWRVELATEYMIDCALVAHAEDISERPAVANRLQESRNSAVISILTERMVDSQIDVTDDELRRFYEENPEEFGHEEQRRVRHIFRRVAKDADPQTWERSRAEMEDILQKIRTGGHFGDLARRLSDSETAHLEGLIGRLSRGHLPAEIDEVVWSLDDGEVSEVITTPIGFHIFKVDDHIAPFHMDFNDAKGRLRRRLEGESRERLVNETFAKLMAESGAVYRPELLDAPDQHGGDTVLFSVGSTVVTMADADRYRESSPFLALRTVPAQGWLREVAWRHLLLWAGDRVDLDEDADFAHRIDREVADAKRRIGFEDYVSSWKNAIADSPEAEAFYDEQYRRYQTPQVHRLRLVVVGFEDFERDYDAFELLESLADAIRNGDRDMAEVAKEISTDPSGARGGDTGWIQLKAFEAWAGPRATRQVSALEVGQVSDPILLESYNTKKLVYDNVGYFIARLEAIEEPRVLDLEEVRSQVANDLFERQRREVVQSIRDGILDSTNVEIFREKL